jgi:hypothetical protein
MPSSSMAKSPRYGTSPLAGFLLVTILGALYLITNSIAKNKHTKPLQEISISWHGNKAFIISQKRFYG